MEDISNTRSLKRERSSQLKASKWAVALSGLLLIVVFIFTHSPLFPLFGIIFLLLSAALFKAPSLSMLWSILVILFALYIMSIGYLIFAPLAIQALAGAIVVFLHNAHALNNTKIGTGLRRVHSRIGLCSRCNLSYFCSKFG